MSGLATLSASALRTLGCISLGPMDLHTPRGGFKCDLPQQWGRFHPPNACPKVQGLERCGKRDYHRKIENRDTHTKPTGNALNPILCLQNNTTYYSVKKNQNWYLFSYMGLRYLILKKDYQESTQNLSILNNLINKGLQYANSIAVNFYQLPITRFNFQCLFTVIPVPKTFNTFA